MPRTYGIGGRGGNMKTIKNDIAAACLKFHISGPLKRHSFYDGHSQQLLLTNSAHSNVVASTAILWLWKLVLLLSLRYQFFHGQGVTYKKHFFSCTIDQCIKLRLNYILMDVALLTKLSFLFVLETLKIGLHVIKTFFVPGGGRSYERSSFYFFAGPLEMRGRPQRKTKARPPPSRRSRPVIIKSDL